MKNVLLLNMPFVSVSRPAIGISILKAVLNREGIPCDVAYPNIRFAEWGGFELYSLLDEKVSDALFAGDWLFAQYLFGDQLDLETYTSTLHHYLEDPEQFDRIMDARGHVGPFLQACLHEYRIEDYRIVGFTSTFEQNLASLAMAKLVKDLFPEKIVVFGGGNCEGEMGVELHRNFPWIDYVCSGESEESFPRLVQAIGKGAPVADIKGIVYREGDESVSTGPSDPIIEMDRIPIPDYDDYHDTVQRSPLRDKLNPALLIETSRGCWWGAKAHCTFCGLNGETMAFRSKSAQRVVDELRHLKERYQNHRFMAVDNIIDMRFFRDVLPQLKAEQMGVSLFYETKANLKKDQVQLLRESGVMAIQPGVESLSSHVLKLMRKGVSAIQNMQLLKWCKEYEVNVAWNLLFGFPGETVEDYRLIADYIDSLYHLQPPHSMGSVRMDRFSPYFNQAKEFGMMNVRPFGIYRLIYPVPPERLEKLVYFFEYDYADGRNPDEYLGEVVEKIERWKQATDSALTKYYSEQPEMIIADTRPNRVHDHVGLDGLHREIYDFCDQKQSLRNIQRFVQSRYVMPEDFQESLQSFLDQMIDWRLMVREGDQYLSLALPGQ